ncbi:hypothetical protein Rs2_01424 [Raphanus sativus]|uniref:Uncharacterized protein LOC108863008 n=1 Tax=Raphanus sativus TaxID=3726 RepID=A0A9W3DJY0_RAPSA|nr:uncharacterized protein LOC108863008 [Raphanus sativus]KAJ4915874.1 hypothetical protein Rs2_01424 [Raphanus sativus]
MLKERQVLPDSSNKNRMSPYPLRSCRSKKQKEEAESPLEPESVSEWEDVRCVICMEPPHNAVLLQCSSFSKGCRAYMCDTSARHSNCFKQYRRNKKNTSRSSSSGSKTLSCPYCRGEVHGTVKSTSARRFMNARPRGCSMDDCEFSGTYSQLKTHLKAEHPGFTAPKLDDPWEHRSMWEEVERAEFIEMINARQRWEAEQRLLAGHLYQLPHHHHHHHHHMIDLNLDAFMHDVFIGVRGQQASAAGYSPAQMSQLGFHGGAMYPRWTP